MSRKDNLRDPSRRPTLLAKRARGYATVPVMLMKAGVVIGVAPTLMDAIRAKASRSKYTPHFGEKQQAKLQRSIERDARAAFA